MQTTPEPISSCDLLFKSARIMDGSGKESFLGDVAVTGDRIAAVGRLDGIVAEHTIDATGHVVAPGFIDVHTHDDQVLLSNPALGNKTSQGVTTVVTGNCGFSLAPLSPDRPLPASFDLLGGAPSFEFADFGQYLDRLDEKTAAVNSVALVGHSTLRYGAMPTLERGATGTEIASMQSVLEKALRAGAVGLSTGLYYPPARAAPTEEVVALAKVVGAEGGIYTTHMRDEADNITRSIEETLHIGREGNVPVLISHHKLLGAQNHGRSRETLEQISRGMREQTVAIDIYPYAAASTVLDPGRCDGRIKVLVTWSKAHPEMAGKYIDAIAAELGCSPVEAANRLLPAGAVYFMMDEADVQRILAFPHAMIGSDGLPHDQKPHPRLWGTFPRVLGHYARDLKIFSLQEAVKRMTMMPASYFGLKDRGTIRHGAFADLVMFDPDTVLDIASYEDSEEVSRGIHTVVVNGTVVWRDGATTSARPGRVLRRHERIGTA